MDAAAWNNLQTTGGMLDLSLSVKLRLSGPDALRYLNGQVTNDVRRLAEGDSLPACLCTHKGKLEAWVMISRTADAFLITADTALRDFLPFRLEKYLIADDAVLEDVTETFALVHLFGPAVHRCEEAPLSSHPSYRGSRMGEPGVDVWLSAGDLTGMTFTDPVLANALRVERGIPAWESELTGGILPPEARLDESAIDFHKGCYTGQEVISRIRSVGQVNRRLERLLAPGGEVLEPGWSLYSAEADGSLIPAGDITSAAWHPMLEKWIALGFVKRSARGANLTAARDPDAPRAAVAIRKTLDDTEP
jgi:folate-binding protein YgfZ